MDHGCRLRPLIFITNNDVLDAIHPNRELRNCSCAILRTMDVVEVHCLCNNKMLYLAKRLPNLHSSRSKGSGVRRVSVLGGSAEDAQFWCIIAVDILGAETGVCPPQARSTEATRVAYL